MHPSHWVDILKHVRSCGRLLRDGLMRQIGRHAISEPEFSVLWACREATTDLLSQKELASVLAVSPAQVSSLVERLRSRGLLEGLRLRTDRRRQYWRPTQAGETLVRELLGDLTSWAEGLDGQFGPRRSMEISRLLRELSQALATADISHSHCTAPASRPLDARSSGDRDMVGSMRGGKAS